jgi:hypothetical protein
VTKLQACGLNRQRIEVSEKATIDEVFVEVSALLENTER